MYHREIISKRRVPYDLRLGTIFWITLLSLVMSNRCFRIATACRPHCQGIGRLVSGKRFPFNMETQLF